MAFWNEQRHPIIGREKELKEVKIVTSFVPMMSGPELLKLKLENFDRYHREHPGEFTRLQIAENRQRLIDQFNSPPSDTVLAWRERGWDLFKDVVEPALEVIEEWEGWADIAKAAADIIKSPITAAIFDVLAVIPVVNIVGAPLKAARDWGARAIETAEQAIESVEDIAREFADGIIAEGLELLDSGRALLPDGTTRALTVEELRHLGKKLVNGEVVDMTIAEMQKWGVQPGTGPIGGSVNSILQSAIDAAKSSNHAYAEALRLTAVSNELTEKAAKVQTVWQNMVRSNPKLAAIQKKATDALVQQAKDAHRKAVEARKKAKSPVEMALAAQKQEEAKKLLASGFRGMGGAATKAALLKSAAKGSANNARTAAQRAAAEKRIAQFQAARAKDPKKMNPEQKVAFYKKGVADAQKAVSKYARAAKYGPSDKRDQAALLAKMAADTLTARSAALEIAERQRAGAPGILIDQKGRVRQGRFSPTLPGDYGEPGIVYQRTGVRSGVFSTHPIPADLKAADDEVKRRGKAHEAQQRARVEILNYGHSLKQLKKAQALYAQARQTAASAKKAVTARPTLSRMGVDEAAQLAKDRAALVLADKAAKAAAERARAAQAAAEAKALAAKTAADKKAAAAAKKKAADAKKAAERAASKKKVVAEKVKIQSSPAYKKKRVAEMKKSAAKVKSALYQALVKKYGKRNADLFLKKAAQSRVSGDCDCAGMVGCDCVGSDTYLSAGVVGHPLHIQHGETSMTCAGCGDDLSLSISGDCVGYDCIQL